MWPIVLSVVHSVLCCTGPKSPDLVAGEGRERELAVDYCVTLRVSPSEAWFFREGVVLFFLYFFFIFF